jgi:flavin-dependent dehydrogenase
MRADLAIVGAGTAGAALAGFAAEAGLSVVCIERRKASEAGARWVNGVPAWTFDQARLARPTGAELRGAGHAFHLVAGRGPRRVVLRRHGVLEVDMRLLVERLQSRALDAGATLLAETRVIGFDGKRLETSSGPVEADTFVDASGLAGMRLLDSPRVGSSDICAAAQEVRAVSDLAAARAFFERHGVEPGDVLCFTGVAGGYSIINVRLEGDTVGILTGSIPGDGHASGSTLLADFVASERWIGARLFGGARAVPLGRPLDRIASGRVALLGDAALQVFAPHGSGIGPGLVAARLLADVLAKGEPPYRYAVAWHRRWGGLFAGYDGFRRLSQTLDGATLERLMASGLIDEQGALAGLEQRLPKPNPALLKAMLRGALSERRLALRLAPVLGRTALALALYRRYPEDPAELPSWSKRVARLL